MPNTSSPHHIDNRYLLGIRRSRVPRRWTWAREATSKWLRSRGSSCRASDSPRCIGLRLQERMAMTQAMKPAWDLQVVDQDEVKCGLWGLSLKFSEHLFLVWKRGAGSGQLKAANWALVCFASTACFGVKSFAMFSRNGFDIFDWYCSTMENCKTVRYIQAIQSVCFCTVCTSVPSFQASRLAGFVATTANPRTGVALTAETSPKVGVCVRTRMPRMGGVARLFEV